MAKLSVKLTGAVLEVSGNGDDCSGSSDPGSFYEFGLGSGRLSADTEIGQRRYEINSPMSFVSLSVPTMQGETLLVQSLSGEDLDVRVTHDTQGATVYPLAAKGCLLLTPSEDEFITAVEVQGEGVIRWVLLGDLA